MVVSYLEVLGIKPGSSAKAIRAPSKLLSISPAHAFFVLNKIETSVARAQYRSPEFELQSSVTQRVIVLPVWGQKTFSYKIKHDGCGEEGGSWWADQACNYPGPEPGL